MERLAPTAAPVGGVCFDDAGKKNGRKGGIAGPVKLNVVQDLVQLCNVAQVNSHNNTVLKLLLRIYLYIVKLRLCSLCNFKA